MLEVGEANALDLWPHREPADQIHHRAEILYALDGHSGGVGVEEICL